MRRMVLLALIGALVVQLAGCAPRPTLHVGRLAAQPDSALMAEMVVATLRRAGARAIAVECLNLLNCGRRLQAGDIDLLPDYSGSARVFFSVNVVQDGSLDAVRPALTAAGMAVTPALGFTAPYMLLMKTQKASANDMTTIEDLSQLDRVRYAVPPGYTRQPGDGLLALARRYGLDIPPEAVAEIASPVDRIAALLADRADVIVMRSPYVRPEQGLSTLEDTLDFYPEYEAMVVMGPRTDQTREFVSSALQPLYGALNAQETAAAIRSIAIQGRDAETVAVRMLVAKGIIQADSPTVRRPEMVVAYTGPEWFSPLDDQAALVLRRAYPDRPVNMLPVATPLVALEQGRADLALVHTSDFFRLTPDGLYLGRDPRAEVITAIGRRQFVLLVSNDVPPQTNPLTLRKGVPPDWTAAGKVASRMLLLAGQVPDRHAAGPSLIRAIRAGELDAAIVALDADTRAVLESLPPHTSMLRVEGLANRLDKAPFFMNEVRLPASTVPGVSEPLETYSMQILLAGSAPRGRTGPVHGGPASAVATRNLPVPLREAEAIASAAESADVPDPVLPSFRTRQTNAPGGIAEAAWLETLLIIAGIAFMVWAGWLLAQPAIRRDS